MNHKKTLPFRTTPPAVFFLGLIALVVLIGIACAAPFSALLGGEEPVNTDNLKGTEQALALKSTELALMATENALNANAPQPENTAPPEIQQPSEAASFQQQPGTILVWMLPDGSLALQKSDGSIIPVDIGIPIDPEGGMPTSTRPISYSTNTIMVTSFRKPYNVLSINSQGRIKIIVAPEVGGELVDAAISPDGTKIVWLFDVTQVEPNPFSEPACDPNSGCIGRVYEIYLTDGMGKNTTKFAEYVVNNTNYPHMEFDSWQSDSQAFFLRLNARVPSALYTDPGGAILIGFLDNQMLVERTTDYLSRSTFISPEGLNILNINDVDKGIKMEIIAPASLLYAEPIDPDVNSLIAQPKFSATNSMLYWLEITTGADWNDITAIDIRGIDRIMGESETLLTLPGPYAIDDLPYIGPILYDQYLIINNKQGSRILSIPKKTWVEFADPQIPTPHLLIGVIQE